LAKIPEREKPGDPEPKRPQLRIPLDEYTKVIQTIHGDGLLYHTFEDIGRYTVFPKVSTDRMFPNVKFGRYDIDEFSKN
jgi:hypothetical protein